jgi:hypothetical protein
MSFNIAYVCHSADRAKSLAASQTPALPDGVISFINAAVDALGTLDANALISVSASGQLGADSAAPGPTAGATGSHVTVTVMPLEITE